jgi:hypothetical protein
VDVGAPGKGTLTSCPKCKAKFFASNKLCVNGCGELAKLRDAATAKLAVATSTDATFLNIRGQLREYSAKAHGRSQYGMQIVVMEFCDWRERLPFNVYGELMSLNAVHRHLHTFHPTSTMGFIAFCSCPDMLHPASSYCCAGQGATADRMVKMLERAGVAEKWVEYNKLIKAQKDRARKTAAATPASSKFRDRVQALAAANPTLPAGDLWKQLEGMTSLLPHQLGTELNPWHTVCPSLSSNYIQLVHADKEPREKDNEEFLNGAESDQQDQDNDDNS